MDPDLSLEEALRPGIPVRRAALHPPAVARLDRLSRHPRPLHAPARHRLLREQPPRHARAAAVRDPQPEAIQGLRRRLLGAHGERRPRPRDPPDRWCRAPLLRLQGPEHPLRAGRRHRRPVGGGRLAAVRARDRAADDPPLPRGSPTAAEPLRLAVQLQPDLQGRLSIRAGMALPGLLRNRAGADRPDDRELQDGFPVEPDEEVPPSRQGIAPRRLCRRAGCRPRPDCRPA